MSEISQGKWWRSAWFVGLLAGVVSGACAGWVTANFSIGPKMGDLEQFWQNRISNLSLNSNTTNNPSPTDTSTTPQIVPLFPTVPVTPEYPSIFLNRRFSPVLPVVKHVTTLAKDGIVNPDRTMGFAVSLTSDGWMVVPNSVLNGSARADLGVLWKGRWYGFTRGITDPSFDVAFVKIDATGLPVTEFVRGVDVTSGTDVWVEGQPGELASETILRTDGRTTVIDPLNSERVARRFVLASRDSLVKSGGAVWNNSGELVGIILERAKGTVQLLPGSVLSSILSQALSGQPIVRSSLDIRTIDLGHVSFEDPKVTLPTQGLWVRSVGVNGPANKLLKEGDVIERVERDSFDGTVDLGERLLDYRPGSVVTIAGLREGKPFQVSIKLGTTSTSEILK